MKFSGANGDRGVVVFPVQLTTNRIVNLTRLILTLAVCVTIRIHTNCTENQPIVDLTWLSPVYCNATVLFDKLQGGRMEDVMRQFHIEKGYVTAED